MDHVLYPITALGFVKLKSKTLVLAGEGPFLRIYDESTRDRLLSHHALKDCTIHGISTPKIAEQHSENRSTARVLIWGGCSVSVIQIDSFTDPESAFNLIIENIFPETQADDWILDACFRSQNENCEVDASEAVLVTAHNILFHWSIFPESDGTKSSFHHAAAGPRSMLYSAHVTWPQIGLGLVAAGTVYGEVLLWPFQGDKVSLITKTPIPSPVHHVFKGHQGSVFGVRIYECIEGEIDSGRRILASCSDDRTIKIWDISLQKSTQENRGISNRVDSPGLIVNESPKYPKVLAISEKIGNLHVNLCLATAMGHSSRIWNLRFISKGNADLQLTSFGEDATTQVWRLSPGSNDQEADEVPRPRRFLLHHQSSFRFHSKKNIWASAVYNQVGDSHLIATGGADGRIVCFTLNHTQRSFQMGNRQPLKTSNQQIIEYIDHREIITAKSHVSVEPGRLFTILEGKWKLFRTFQSSNSNYPSGTLEGTAIFERRAPTSPDYDDEYLYTEDGQFLTEQGLRLGAHRHYVYRFQKGMKVVTAWFVKPSDNSSVDYLFHKLEITSIENQPFGSMKDRNTQFVKARGHHLCIDDDYYANYLFEFKGLNCSEWGVEYIVKGPKKDYIANSKYLRVNATQTWRHGSNFDGIIEQASVLDIARTSPQTRSLNFKADSFKNYTWISKMEVLTSTAGGFLILGFLRSLEEKRGHEMVRDGPQSFSWQEIGQLDDLRSSCFFSSIRSCGVLHFAGASGTIYCYRHSNKSLQAQLHTTRNVCYLKSHLLNHASGLDVSQEPRSLELGIVVASIGSRTVDIFLIDMDLASSNRLLSLIHLSQEQGFVVTSSCFSFCKEVVVLGSRNGDLAIYDIAFPRIGMADLDKSCYCENIHGNDSVTSIQRLPMKVSESETGIQYMLTTGRNGTFSIHQMKYHRGTDRELLMSFQTMHVGTTSFGPNIEGACFDKMTRNMLLWGFRSKEFVVWNESQGSEIMTVDCGGAHRNWAFTPHEDCGGSLIWTKASMCNVYSQSQASHEILSIGGHGREIKAMAISPQVEAANFPPQRYIATGAEDTSIRIFRAYGSTELALEHQYKCVGIITKHTTGIQQLQWSSDGQRLFSAAGREEFFIWRVQSVPCIEVGIVSEFSCDAVTHASDLRIMSFEISDINDGGNISIGTDLYQYMISMVYSDSSVRVSRNHSFSLKSS